jgi:hypothetical protein
MSDGTSHITYRNVVVDGETNEWPTLAPIFGRHRLKLPDARLSTAAVAELPEGGIIGAGILQFVLYMGPFVVDEKWRGKVNLRHLQALLHQRAEAGSIFPGIPGYIFHAANDEQAHAIEQLDNGAFKQVDGKWFIREF